VPLDFIESANKLPAQSKISSISGITNTARRRLSVGGLEGLPFVVK
jgi:hypothetical protein